MVLLWRKFIGQIGRLSLPPKENFNSIIIMSFFPFLPFVFLFPPSFLLRMDGSTGRIDSAQRQPKKEAMDRRERDSAVHKQCNISIRSWIFSGSAFFFIAGNLYMEIVVVWNQGKNNSLRCFYSYSRCCCNRIFFWGDFLAEWKGILFSGFSSYRLVAVPSCHRPNGSMPIQHLVGRRVSSGRCRCQYSSRYGERGGVGEPKRRGTRPKNC